MPIIFIAMGNEENKDKLERIWSHYRGLMLYIAKDMLKDTHAAEDAVSEAFIKIIRNINKIQEISYNQTKAYTVSIIKSVTIDIMRKGKGGMENLEVIGLSSDTDILGDLRKRKLL